MWMCVYMVTNQPPVKALVSAIFSNTHILRLYCHPSCFKKLHDYMFDYIRRCMYMYRVHVPCECVQCNFYSTSSECMTYSMSRDTILFKKPLTTMYSVHVLIYMYMYFVNVYNVISILLPVNARLTVCHVTQYCLKRHWLQCTYMKYMYLVNVYNESSLSYFLWICKTCVTRHSSV